MQTLFEAASHIAQEIERTRQHLTNLEQALEGLKPLITVDAATTTLTFSISSQAQPIEDLSVVNAQEPAKKKAKSKLAVKAKAEKPKAAGKAKVTKEPVVQEPVPAVEPIKLPATGAEFWLKCLGRKKSTVAQLADAALKKLKLMIRRKTSWPPVPKPGPTWPSKRVTSLKLACVTVPSCTNWPRSRMTALDRVHQLLNRLWWHKMRPPQRLAAQLKPTARIAWN